MRKWLGGAALSTVLALGLAAQPAAAARATITFADLTGRGQTGSLVLDDFSFDSAGSGTFVSWDYYRSPGLLTYHLGAADRTAFSSNLLFSFVGQETINESVTIQGPGSLFRTGLDNPDGPNLLWGIELEEEPCPPGPGGVICGGGDGPQVESNPPPTYRWQLFSVVESSPPDTGVPEPMTWTLMISGLGLAGAQLRARRRRRV